MWEDQGEEVSPAEIVATTERVAGTFGADIAHEVCCRFLQQRPDLRVPLHWWRRTARYVRNEQREKVTVRRAPRYWTEARWATTRRLATPEQSAACWELVDRIPAEVTLQLVLLEGVRGDQQQVLRTHARRYARGG